MNLELSDREDCAPLTTATSPHKQLSQNGAHHIHRKLMLWATYHKFCRDKAINNIKVPSAWVVSFRNS
jgi:hypothetical protein